MKIWHSAAQIAERRQLRHALHLCVSKPVAMTVIFTSPFIDSSRTAPKMMLASDAQHHE